MHRLHTPALDLAPSGVLRLDGDEAHHALRVRRLRVGGAVELFDGRGGTVRGRVAGADARGRWLDVEPIGARHRTEPSTPHVEVVSCVPKGDRLATMIDQLSQLGVAAWRPLRTARAVVDPRETKLDRMRRVAIESAKQCGRAWLLEIGEAATIEEASVPENADTRVLIGDAHADPIPRERSGSVRVLVGPEGGFTPDERELAIERGATPVRLGPHVMRIETAAVAAGAILMGAATPPAPPTYNSQEDPP